MAITYNITKDYFYQQGQQEMQRKKIVTMLEDKTLSLEKIAEFAHVPLEYVQQVAEELKKQAPHCQNYTRSDKTTGAQASPEFVPCKPLQAPNPGCIAPSAKYATVHSRRFPALRTFTTIHFR
jgi:predicted HTH domain antitoxin